jgi:hypothetical protein
VTAGGAWRCALSHLALRTKGAGNPAGPSGREEIAEFYTVNRTAILIVAPLHVFGGFFFPVPGRAAPDTPCQPRAVVVDHRRAARQKYRLGESMITVNLAARPIVPAMTKSARRSRATPHATVTT